MLGFSQEGYDAIRANRRGTIQSRLLSDFKARGIPATAEKDTFDVLVGNPSSARTRIGINDLGQVETLKRPSGSEYRLRYDRDGRSTEIVHPNGQTIALERDAVGRVVSTTLDRTQKTSLSYDASSALSGVTYPDGSSEKFRSDALGDIVEYQDRSGFGYSVTKTSAGRVRQDSLGHTTSHLVDTFGHLDKTLFPDGSFEEYFGDPETNVITVRLRNGAPLGISQDETEKGLGLEWADSQRLDLAFDDHGNLIKADSAQATLEQVFDDEGRLATQVTADGAVKFGYSDGGQLAHLETHHGEKVQYRYDADGRLTHVIDWEGRVIRFVFGKDDVPEQVQFPNGTVEHWKVGRSPRSVSVKLVGPAGTALVDTSYTYDQCDRLQLIRDNLASGPKGGRKLAYDQASRLISEVDAATGQSLQSYKYDVAGNMTSDGRTARRFGPMDNVIECEGAAVDYDALGNVIQADMQRRRAFTFSHDGRLRSAKVGGETWEYEYDGFCRRISKGNGTEKWRYGWAGPQLLWEEHQKTPDAEPIRRDYLYAPGCVAPLAFRERGQTYWVHTDLRGAVTSVHDARGKIVWLGRYQSFGEVKEVVAEIRQPWRLLGQYADEETGLYYNLVRYYCPYLKTYLSLDPRWEERAATNYSYARNDPWNRADPTGMIAPLLLVAGVAVVSGAIAAAMAPEGEKMGAFLGGAAAGAIGAAVGLAVVALGASVLAAAAIVVTGAVVAGAIDALIQEAWKPGDICWPCAWEAMKQGAIIGGAAEALMLGLGKLIPTSVKKATANALIKRLESFKKAIAKVVGGGGKKAPSKNLGAKGTAGSVVPAKLDEAFGKPQGPTKVKGFEKNPDGSTIKNPTAQEVTPENPPKLDPKKEYIWVVDEKGKMIVGEEVKTGVVESDGYVQKLGHPTLTEGGNGRIGGELRFDEATGGWKMNNKSGRYSSHPDRGPEQLQNAAEVMNNAGQPVTSDFKPLK